MNEIVNDFFDEFLYIDKVSTIEECKEGQLAHQIFGDADAKVTQDRIDILKSISNTIPAVADIVKGMKKTDKLVFAFSDEIQKKIDDGTYKLMKSKTAKGLFKAVVVDKDNKVRNIADLKWEEVSQGIDMTKLAAVMQGNSIQTMLKEVSNQLGDMSEALDIVLAGQHNDRLAKYLSGEAIYREALSTDNMELRKSLTSSAIQSLTEASSSLQASLVQEIGNICSKYDAERRRFVDIKIDQLREKMYLINSSFQAIHKANTLKAAIYYREGEYKALTMALTNYKNFLERSLNGDTAHILYLADPREKSFNDVWNVRQKELPLSIDKTRDLLINSRESLLELSIETE